MTSLNVEKKAAEIAAKYVLLTGANGGIGKAIALGAAKKPGVHLIVPVRTEEKGKALVAELTKATGNKNIAAPVVDLSSKASIAKLTAAVAQSYPRVDVLINNAAVVPKSRETNADGLEMQFATNVAAYFHLATGLKDLLKKSGASRVVNVASNYAGGLDPSDLQFSTRSYDENDAYRQSKQANRMMSWAMADKWKDDKITVNACHPGVVTTPLLKNLGMSRGFDSAEAAAATPLFLAFDDSVASKTGTYWNNKTETACPWRKDMKSCNALYDYLAKL